MNIHITNVHADTQKDPMSCDDQQSRKTRSCLVCGRCKCYHYVWGPHEVLEHEEEHPGLETFSLLPCFPEDLPIWVSVSQQKRHITSIKNINNWTFEEEKKKRQESLLFSST